MTDLAEGDAPTSATVYPPSPPHELSSPAATPIPIRSNDYRSDSDDDGVEDVDEDDLVYAKASAPSLTRGTKNRHHPRPSTSALLPLSSATRDDSLDLDPARGERLREEYGLELDDGSGARRVKGRWDSGREFLSRNEGFLLIALAQGLFAGVNTFVKILTERVAIPVWELIVIRMSVTWIACVIYMKWAKVEHPFLGPPGVRLLLITRGVVGFGGLYGIYFSLKYLSLSDATVLSFLSPILVGILAAAVLKESYSRTEALCGLSSLGGVVLIAKPSFLFPDSTRREATGPGGAEVTVAQRELAVGVALMGVLGSAGAYLTIRKIGTRANALHSISYFSLYSTIVASLYPFFFDAPPIFELEPIFFALILPVGIMGFFAQCLLTVGLQKERAGRGTLAVYTNIIYTLILELAVFHKLPDFFSMVGTTVIVGGALYVALDKNKKSDGVAGERRGSVSRREVDGDVESGLLGGVGKESDAEAEGRKVGARVSSAIGAVVAAGDDLEGGGLGGRSIVLPAAGGSGDR